MLERDHSCSSSIRCPIQARPRHAEQYQEDRQPRRPRRRSQQAQDHPASTTFFFIFSHIFLTFYHFCFVLFFRGICDCYDGIQLAAMSLEFRDCFGKLR